MQRNQRRSLATIPVGILTVALAACGSAPMEAGRTPASASTGPALTVERFLGAANANDLGTMTQLFGTTDRNIVGLEGQTRAERRMYILASLCRHDDWSIMGQQAVPGRMIDSTELLVEITRGGQSVTVPFLVVRTDEGGWIIERIDVEPLTGLPSG